MKPIHRTTLNVFSIDVEDWYQSTVDYGAGISEVCLNNTRAVMRLLEAAGVSGTFFVQGLVAKTYPGLIKEIDDAGHEVQSHGFSHRPVNMMGPKEFKRELTDTSRYIEDAIGRPATGFRAPDFSIDKDSYWAFEVMAECGIRYDSSIFPLRTRRYGVTGFERGYSIIKTPSGCVEELPVSVLQPSWLGHTRVPVGGGGYFRLLPKWFLKYSLSSLDEEGLPFVIYCHPYEFNAKELKEILSHIPLSRRLHQGIGRKGFPGKVAALLAARPFTTMSNVLEALRHEAEEKCA